jgi:hypothetical protein
MNAKVASIKLLHFLWWWRRREAEEEVVVVGGYLLDPGG